MAESQPILAQAASQSTCPICGSQCPPYKGRKGPPRKFCSLACQAEWRRQRWTGNKLRNGLKPVNSFQPGHETWNKNVKGLHHSPATEFKKGQTPVNKQAVGDVTIRIDKTNKPRAWVKVAEPNVWTPRAVVSWEQANARKVPSGHVVHHRDRDTLNDDPRNLELQTRAEHIAEHREEHLAIKRARPKRTPKPQAEKLLF